MVTTPVRVDQILSRRILAIIFGRAHSSTGESMVFSLRPHRVIIKDPAQNYEILSRFENDIVSIVITKFRFVQRKREFFVDTP
jgi:hypothetical protein